MNQRRKSRKRRGRADVNARQFCKKDLSEKHVISIE